MVTNPTSTAATLENSSSAIRLLAENGYDSTTAEALADTVGMSRSTFFRRFGSKDDVIFADHDHALKQLEAFLTDSTLSVADALANGTADVLRLLTRDPDAARLRLELMRHTPSLRDRELVITHRYERVFVRHLNAALATTTPDWVAPALSAGIVAVHNRTLRNWLRGTVHDAPRVLARDLRSLTSLYDQWLSPDADRDQRRVLVAVYDATGSPESVLQAVSAELHR